MNVLTGHYCGKVMTQPINGTQSVNSLFEIVSI